MNSNGDTSILPNNVFHLKGDEFFRLIRNIAGETVCEILQIQLIDSTQLLLNTPDLFDIFKYDSIETNHLRNKACFKTANGDYILKSGIITNVSRLTTLLNAKNEEQQASYNDQRQERIINLINENPMLKSLVQWFERTDEKDKQAERFLNTFIDTIADNLARSPNNYRFSEPVEQFALSLYILGGKMTYQFVRVDLSPALPSIQTLNMLISTSGIKMNEGQFGFDQLHEYLNRIHVRFAFGSEDYTGVIRKINYDQWTNSFVGFATPLANGIPVAHRYMTNSYEELKSWFASCNRSSLLNAHIIQPLPPANQSNAPAAFLLSAYGVVNTYTSMDVLQRWIYIFNKCVKRNIRIVGFSTGKNWVNTIEYCNASEGSLSRHFFHFSQVVTTNISVPCDSQADFLLHRRILNWMNTRKHSILRRHQHGLGFI